MRCFLILLLSVVVVAKGAVVLSPTPSADELSGLNNVTANQAWVWANIALNTFATVPSANASVDTAFWFSPPVLARYLSLVNSAMFEATVPYVTLHGNVSSAAKCDLPAFHGSNGNASIGDDINTSVSYAALRVIEAVFADFPDILTSVRNTFTSQGYDLTETSVTSNNAPSIGNQAARCVIRMRSNDGSNSAGSETGTTLQWKDVGYADYSNYDPINLPQGQVARTLCGELIDINHWQPLLTFNGYANFSNGTAPPVQRNPTCLRIVVPAGTNAARQSSLPASTIFNGSGSYYSPPSQTYVQQFMQPHWGLVWPFSDFSFNQVREFLNLSGPVLYDSVTSSPAGASSNSSSNSSSSAFNMSDPFVEMNRRMLNLSGQLTDDWKANIHLWTIGVNGSFAVGQWQYLALGMIRAANLSVFETTKLLFLQSAAVLDTTIAVWELKRTFDSAAPMSSIQCLFAKQRGNFWRGPYQGIGNSTGAQFLPYQPLWRLSPSWAEYPSDVSAVSAASAAVLRAYFNDSDVLNATAVFRPTDSWIEPLVPPPSSSSNSSNSTNTATASTAPHFPFKAGLTDVAAQNASSKGYSPPSSVTLKFATLTDAVTAAEQSAQYAGINYPASVHDGSQIGRAVGKSVWDKYAALISGDAVYTRSVVISDNSGDVMLRV